MFVRIRQRDLARRDGVQIRYYTIIYDVIDDMRAALCRDIWPTDTAPVIRQLEDATTEFAQLRWGFTPPRPKGAPASARSTDPIPPGHIRLCWLFCGHRESRSPACGFSLSCPSRF